MPATPLGQGQSVGSQSLCTNAFTSPLLTAFNTPSRLLDATPGVGAALSGRRAPAVDPKYREHITSITNKYAKLSKVMSSLDEPTRNAIMDYDSSRVAKGSPPLTEQQTLAVIQTLQTNKPATPAPAKSPFNLLANFRSDLSDIVKSVPRIPFGIAHEVGDLPHFGERVQENEAAGMNPLAALLKAPGVRMIPGSFVAGNLAEGGKGLKELATHPLMAGLDLLPAANKLAEGTEVARAARELTDAAGKRARPINAVLTGRVLRDDAGNLVRGEVGAFNEGLPVLGRNRLGQGFDMVRDETGIGRALDSFGGKRSRGEARDRGLLEQRGKMLLRGMGTAENAPEELALQAGKLFEKHTKEYPELALDAAGPEMDAARAKLLQGVQRTPENYSPALVADIEDFNYRAAKLQEAQGRMGQFDGEWYDKQRADKLYGHQDRVNHTTRMVQWRPLATNPTATTTVGQLKSMVDEVADITGKNTRAEAAKVLENIMSAHGVPDELMKQLSSVRAAIGARKATPGDWTTAAHAALEQHAGTLASALDDAAGGVDGISGATGTALKTDLNALTMTPRRTLGEMLDVLKKGDYRKDPQAARLRDAIATGNRKITTDVLKNLYDRKPPALPEELYPAFREDARSMSRRIRDDNDWKHKYTDAKLEQQTKAFENARDKANPGRFDPILTDKHRETVIPKLTEKAEEGLGRRVTPEEAGQIVASLEQRTWGNMPGIDAETAAQIVKQNEQVVIRTWRMLRDEGHNPLFVHKVSPGRANQATSMNVGVVSEVPSQVKARTLDLSPGVQDLAVSLRHQASEVLQEHYNQMHANQIIDSIGESEASLRARFAPEAERRAILDPDLDFEGHLERIMRRGHAKFNPDEVGLRWGGSKLSKFNQENWWIPKSVEGNLKNYAKPPSLFTSAIDPISRAFRYNVLGLSPSVIMNNFFGNSIAVMGESGVGPFKYWSQAREWLKDPSKIPSEELRGMILAETPDMQYLSRSHLNPRLGDKFINSKAMEGFNAAHAFKDSAFHEALKAGKRGVDGVVEKSLKLQQLGDNVYRAMQYMDEHAKQIAKGAAPDAAERAAMEQVRRSLVDFTSFTQVERAAMRTIIPFYSYMSHAARYIMRYPLDHPLRASILSHIAAAERERLGTLPGSYLSMVPIPDFLPGGGKGKDGKQNMLALRPFDAFGDISNLTSVAGWLSAMNPVIQTGLEQVGVNRGEAELYPTMRYNPESGHMEAVHGNPIGNLLNNAIPRAGLLTAALGVNSQYNDIKSNDPNAASRMLVSMSGLPRAWRSVSPVQDQIKTEVARQTSANQVRNEAMKSGSWNEALKYPSLRAAYQELMATNPDVIAAYQPSTPQAIKALLDAVSSGKTMPTGKKSGG